MQIYSQTHGHADILTTIRINRSNLLLNVMFDESNNVKMLYTIFVLVSSLVALYKEKH